MENLMFCKYCGILISDLFDNFGTNSDGSRNTEYCISCFENGELKNTLQTTEEKVQGPIEHITAEEKLPEDKVCNYRLLQKIGEGGMGDVYAAEQEKPIRRRVALKIVKHGMDTKEVVARFESERQALALMDHPNIAKVFEAGATERGRPYFAMEYVRGVPIIEHCDTHRLNTRERLELFMQVCEGVQHAHQKAIIHRDLKPSNVLVTIQDDKAVPKIIDFGVAKATAQRLTERTMFTELGQLIGTPEYMSPEQAEMTGQGIDTRTDVYSLGVILYELLVGTLPFDARELREAGFDGIRRKIREDEPSKPSTRVSTPGDASKISAKNRRTDLRGLRSQLRGDLDWITMKALEKDRTRRYGSPSELAADISRHLRNEPVLARPPSTTYRMQKFFRRHRVAVFAGAVVVLALAIGAVATTVGMVRALRAERTAQQEAETALRVSEFLVELFKVSDPSEVMGNTITAREILDMGAERITQELEDQPIVQARLMNIMGMVYRNLGLYEQATSLLDQALMTRRTALGEEHLDVSESLNSLAALIYAKGDYTEAERLFRKALAIRRTLLGDEHLDVAKCLNNLAMTLKAKGNYTEAEPMYREALAIRRKLLGNENTEVAQSLNNLGMFLYRKGEYREAERLFRQALAMNRKLLGEEHPEVSTNLNNLALVLRDSGSYAEAEPIFRQVLAMDRRFLGDNHPYVALTLNNLGALLIKKGDYTKAELAFHEAIDVQRKTFSENHWQIANSKGLLGGCLTKLGQYKAAEKLVVESYWIIKNQFSEEHRRTRAALKRIIDLYETWDKPAKAAEYRALLSGLRSP